MIKKEGYKGTGYAGLEVTLWICMSALEVLGSNLDRSTTYTEVYMVFHSPSQAYAGTEPRLRHDPVIQNPFKFITNYVRGGVSK
jgi:hypothetical protein